MVLQYSVNFRPKVEWFLCFLETVTKLTRYGCYSILLFRHIKVATFWDMTPLCLQRERSYWVAQSSLPTTSNLAFVNLPRFGCVVGGGGDGAICGSLFLFCERYRGYRGLTRKIVFCIQTPCCLVSYRRFRETWCHYQGKIFIRWFCYTPTRTRCHIPEGIFSPPSRCIEISENAGITEASGRQRDRKGNITFFVYPSKLKACCPNTDVTSQCAVPCIGRSNHNGAVVRVNC